MFLSHKCYLTFIIHSSLISPHYVKTFQMFFSIFFLKNVLFFPYYHDTSFTSNIAHHFGICLLKSEPYIHGGNDLHSNVFSYFLFLYKTTKRKKKNTIKSDFAFPFPLSERISHAHAPASSLHFLGSLNIEHHSPSLPGRVTHDWHRSLIFPVLCIPKYCLRYLLPGIFHIRPHSCCRCPNLQSLIVFCLNYSTCFLLQISPPPFI